VLIASLKVILRPAQQYSSQPPSAHTSNISSTRLQNLAQSWSILREQGIELHDLLDNSKPNPTIDLSTEAGDITFQFYRKTAESKVSGPSNNEQPEGPAILISEQPTAVSETSSPGPSTSVVPTQGSKQPIPGLNTVHLPAVALSTKEPMHILADAVEEYDIPDEEKYPLLCKIRLAQALVPNKQQEREKITTARLLAIAIFG